MGAIIAAPEETNSRSHQTLHCAHPVFSQAPGSRHRWRRYEMKQAACRLKTEGSLVASCCAGASDWKQRYLEPDNRVVSLDRTHHAHFRGGRPGSGACTQCAAADEAHIAGPSAEDHVPCVTCKGGASAKAASQRFAEEHSEEKAPTEGRGSSIRRKRVEIAMF